MIWRIFCFFKYQFHIKLPVADFETVLNTASSSAKVVDLFYYVLTANNLKKPSIYNWEIFSIFDNLMNLLLFFSWFEEDQQERFGRLESGFVNFEVTFRFFSPSIFVMWTLVLVNYSQGYSLQIATLLGENQKVFYDNIEDILDQADEVDKKYLQVNRIE